MYTYKKMWPPEKHYQFTFKLEKYNDSTNTTYPISTLKNNKMAPKFGYWSIQGVSFNFFLNIFYQKCDLLA